MKGLFTQGLMLLTDGVVDLASLAPLLAPFGELRQRPSTQPWPFGNDTLMVPFGERGNVLVDVVAQPWPDGMGDPKNEIDLFAAWSMGHLGPQTYPGGLVRAAEQAWSHPPFRKLGPPPHRGFIRVRVTYAVGAASEDPVRPADYRALPELEHVTAVTRALAAHANVVAYFDPNGEVLLPIDGLTTRLDEAQANELPALNVWANIRLFNLGAAAPGWAVMDTVGMGQLDVPDLEALVPRDRYELGDIDLFLRNVGHYLVTSGRTIEAGDTVDGPGGAWQCESPEESLTAPPRDVLRFHPLDGSKRPTL